MKALVYKSQLLPYSEVFIREQVMALRRWHPTLVGDKRLANGLDLSGIDIRVLNPAGFLGKLLRKLAYFTSIAPLPWVRGLAREKFDIFHVHFGTEAVHVWPLARALGLPMVVTLHGSDIAIHRDWWRSGKGGALMRGYPRHIARVARHPGVHFVAVSEAVRERAIARGIPAEKIHVCYIGVDIGRFVRGPVPVEQRARRVLYVGRLVEKKGCTYLVEAFARVQRAVPDAELVIVGDGPLHAELSAMAVRLGINATFTGALPSQEVRKRFDEARVFCLPSVVAANGDSEGLPIVIIESGACGVPVVTSAVGGATEGIVDGVTGFAFEERNVDQLADRLVRLLTDDALASSMSRAGAAFVRERFDIAKCTDQLENLYDSLVPGRQ